MSTLTTLKRFITRRQLRTGGLALIVSFGCVSAALAEKNVPLDTKLCTLESPLLAETFSHSLRKSLQTVKGQWNIVDGTLRGKELAADKHAAVLNCDYENRNSAVRFSFKLDGSTEGLQFSLNHARGHLFRVVVSPTAMTVMLDKDKKDPNSKAVQLGSTKGVFEQGKWYTMQIEIVGDKVYAQTDNGVRVQATHASLDTVKPNYRFVMRGDSLSIDDLHIWELK